MSAVIIETPVNIGDAVSTSVKDLKQWFDRGKRTRATHMIVVCDTFSYEDYPVYVSATENVHAEYFKRHGINMQTVMEVYSYKKPFDAQRVGRAFNFD